MRMFQLRGTLICVLILLWGILGLDAGDIPVGYYTRSEGVNFDSSSDSYVIPLSQQKGTLLEPSGKMASTYGSVLPWFLRLPIEKRWHYQNSTSGHTLAIENPVAVFGGGGDQSHLYSNRSYRFAVYGGMTAEKAQVDASSISEIRIRSYPKSGFIENASNVSPDGEVLFRIPRQNSSDWTQYVQNGYRSRLADLKGLQTVWTLDPKNTNRHVLTHFSTTSDHYFTVEVLGYLSNADGLVLNEAKTAPAFSPLYAVDFEERGNWNTEYVSLPQFQGEPMPPTYQGKDLEELLHDSPSIARQFAVPNVNFLQVDNSPELRSHPQLDKLVQDLGNDPIALANYVHNEIQLTNAISVSPSTSDYTSQMDIGGMSRSALGTYLEGQGSPIEQCALLVYLLRKSGVPAGYVFGGRGDLKLIDSQVGRMIGMQVKGAVYSDGSSMNVPSLISVNYPWVAAYVGGKWVHLFPWLKDIEVVEGKNLYDYLPEGYRSGFEWVKKYINYDPNIMGLSRESDAPDVLFPKFIEKSLQTTSPGTSLDELGVKLFQRKHYASSWSDFSKPWNVTETNGSMLLIDRLDREGYRNWLNTVDLTVYSKNNPSKSITLTGINAMDLHSRRFIIRFEKTGSDQHRLYLSLAPYRSDVSGQGDFSLWPTNAMMAHKKTLDLDSTDSLIMVKSVYNKNLIIDRILGFLNTTETSQLTTERPISKGSLVSIDFNFGKVSKKMVKMHAEEVWKLEKALKDNSSTTVDSEEMQGELAYLMGLGYFQKCSDFDLWNEKIHKISRQDFYAFGFSGWWPRVDSNGALPNHGDIDLAYPYVDMSIKHWQSIGNETIHPNINDNEFTAFINSYGVMSIVNGSAQEHRIMNSYLSQEKAVSTISLLLDAAKNGVGLVEMTQSDYQTKREQRFAFDSTTKTLKEWWGTEWPDIEKDLSDSNSGSSTIVFSTPSPRMMGPGPYQGYLTISKNRYAGIISAFYTTNGGAGADTGVGKMAPSNFPNISLGWVDDFPSLSFGAPSGINLWDSSSLPNWNFSSDLDALGRGEYLVGGFDRNSLISWEDTYRFTSSLTGSSRDALSFGSIENFGFLGAPRVYNDFNSGNTPAVSLWDSVSRFVGDPVNVVNGEFYIDTVDLALKGSFPFEIRRNYSSQNLSENDFGYGWKFSFIPYLSTNTDESILFAAETDGSVIAYRKQSDGTTWKPESLDNPSLTNFKKGQTGGTANLFLNRITKQIVSGVANYTLTGSDGSKRLFVVKSFPSGTITRERPYLTQWTDAQGNYYTFQFGSDSSKGDYGKMNRVVASNGNFIGLNYDITGRAVEIFTRDGRRLLYDYDEYNDLTQVTLPDGHQYHYEYQHKTDSTTNTFYSEHLIVREIKPEGRILENEYDTTRRVVKQKATAGSDLIPVQNAFFEYFNSTDSVTKVQTGYTLIHDAYDRVTRYDYNRGLITKVTDPLGQIQSTDWNFPEETPGVIRSMKTTTDKRGLVTEYFYDAIGNIDHTRNAGDLTGDGLPDEAITRFAYNAQNLVTQITDPLGNKTKYDYTNTQYPYLPSAAHRLDAANTEITQTTFDYTSVDNAQAKAYGLLLRERQAAGTTDEAVKEMEYDTIGMVKSIQQFTKTTDANVVTQYRYNYRNELVEETDPSGVKKSYAYDDRGNPIWQEVRDTSGKLISWNYQYYNGNGEIEWVDGPRWGAEDYVWTKYDGAGRVKESTKWRSRSKVDGSGVESESGDALYATTFYKYNIFGDFLEKWDPNHRITKMTYDGIGQLLTQSVFAEDSNTPIQSRSRTNEPGGKPATETNALGAVTRHFYALNGLHRRTENPDGSTVECRYDLLGRKIQEIYSNGTFREIQYEDGARQVTERLKNGTTVLSSKQVRMDRRGNVIEKIDELANHFLTEYDGLNRIKTETSPASVAGGTQPVRRYSYDPLARQVSVKNALNEETQTIQDALGRVISEKQLNGSGALLRETTYEYSPDHQYVKMTTGGISTTTYTNTYGQKVLEKQLDGSFDCFEIDSVGQIVSKRDAVGQITRYERDLLSRVVTETMPDGKAIGYFYDAENHLLERRMPAGNTWVATYLPSGKKNTEELRNGTNSTRKYTYGYFANGKSIGNLETVTDPLGFVANLSYDDWMRVSSKVVKNSGNTVSLQASYEYDLLGHPKLVSETSNGKQIDTTCAYDPNGHLLSEEIKIDGVSHSKWTQQWNGAQRRAALIGDATLFPSLRYDFETRLDGLLKGVTLKGQTFTYDYQISGLLDKRTSPFGVAQVQHRDVRGRVMSEDYRIGGVVSLSESMEWTLDSKLKSNEKTLTGVVDKNPRDYFYDNRSRLTREGFQTQAGKTSYVDHEFDTTGLGVKTLSVAHAGFAKKVTLLDSFIRPKTEMGGIDYLAQGTARGADFIRFILNGSELGNIANYAGWKGIGDWSANLQLFPGAQVLDVQAVHPSGVTKSERRNFTVTGTAGTWTLQYDATGQVTSRQSSDGKTQTLTWDASNRLVQVTERDSANNGFNWNAIYDGLGRRIQTSYAPVTGNTVGATNTIKSYFDPQVEFLELGVEVAGQKYWKVFGPDLNGVYGGLNGIGGLEAVIKNSDSLMVGVVNDFYGNVVGTVSGTTLTWNPTKVSGYGPIPSTSAVVLEKLTSSPSSSDVAQAYAWRSRRIDGTGFINLGARHYEYQSGRFLSPDPLGHASSMSLYDYANGDPVNRVDADGRVGKQAVAQASWLYDMGNNAAVSTLMSGPFRTIGLADNLLNSGFSNWSDSGRWGNDADVIDQTFRSPLAQRGYYYNNEFTSAIQQTGEAFLPIFAGKLFPSASSSSFGNKIGFTAEDGISGSTFDGSIYRAPYPGANPLTIDSYNIAANHRYSSVGEGALYFSTNVNTVTAELGGSLGNRAVYSFDRQLNNLLDLSSSSIRSDLGISLEDIVRREGSKAYQYEITQPLGTWAREQGYGGIIAPSAQADGGLNIILFQAP